MKKSVVLAVFVTAVLALSSSALAATVDIVNYLGLKPGKWSISRSATDGSLMGHITVSGANGQIIRKWYSYDGSLWIFDSSQVFKVSSTSLQIIGSNDGTDMWVSEHPLTLPRLLTVDRAYQFSGITRNTRTNETRFGVISMLVTQRGFTAHTGAGIFFNCMKFRSYHYSPGRMRMSTQICAPGRESVKSWTCKIEDTADPEKETRRTSASEVVQFGDSNPPIP